MDNDQLSLDEILAGSSIRHVIAISLDGVPAVNCEIDHPKFGWIPITLTHDEYPETYARALAMVAI